MSFSVALQSAIFYVCACTPCAQAREHRQSKKQAKKDRAEKERLQAEMPHLYCHPDPFNTNPYWTEEIMIGPTLPSKKANTGSKNTSQRGLQSAGRDSRSITGSSIGIGSSTFASSPTVVPEGGELSLTPTMSMALSDDWNKKRYQREDEELWGRELYRQSHKLMDAIKQTGTNAKQMLEARLGKEPRSVTEEDRYNFYSAARNPPVNDYHPPVVSQRPVHKDAAKWMLQPPPPAKVMEGKVPVSRSTSLASQVSHGSRRTNASDEHALGRILHEKMVEAKLRKGEMPSEIELPSLVGRPSIGRRTTSSSRGGRSQRSTRSRSLSLDSVDSSEDLAKRRMSRRRPTITVDADYSSDDEATLRASVDPLGLTTRAAQRPNLHTIASSQASSVKGDQDLDNSKAHGNPTSTGSPLRDISNTTPSNPSPTKAFAEELEDSTPALSQPA